MRNLLASVLMATGTDYIPEGYDVSQDYSLHKETTKSAGRVVSENYYKTFDEVTGTLSDLAVAVAYSYSGAKLLSRETTYYFIDGSVGVVNTVAYKTDSEDTNRVVEIRTTGGA